MGYQQFLNSPYISELDDNYWTDNINVIVKQSIYSEPDEVVEDAVIHAPEWETISPKFRLSYNRMSACKFLQFSYVLCNGCGNKKEKKKVKLSCMNSYCLNHHCVKNRKVAWLSKFEHLNIKSKKLLHYVLGFPRIKKLNEVDRQKRLRVLNTFDKIMRRTCSEFHSLFCNDLAGSKHDLYNHIHGGNLPVKDRVEFCRKIENARKLTIKKTGHEFSVEVIGYRDTKSLLRYFAKRMAGILGHKVNGKYLSYSDLMTAKEYYKYYYRKKLFKLSSLRLFEEKSGVLSLLNIETQICEYCGSKKFHLVPKSWYKPPPAKSCPDCNEKIDPREWDYQRDLCRLCSYHQSHEYKTDQIRNKIFGNKNE